MTRPEGNESYFYIAGGSSDRWYSKCMAEVKGYYRFWFKLARSWSFTER